MGARFEHEGTKLIAITFCVRCEKVLARFEGEE